MDDFSDQLRTQTALIIADALGARQVFGGMSTHRAIQDGLCSLRQEMTHSEYLPGASTMTRYRYTVRVDFTVEREEIE